ncbi:hypothetical protein [Enterococcus faecalis]|uniref:Uncharacterized protein n=1 Tax=Enterococcus faecalis RP2S-4 TaxID=1244145 RepID=A0ABC9THM2_ENTFL|nr:hypothetical protein [Enterococcus faecalis]EPI05700.1 hypothetical protein D358_02364 [Enterococcus faecalis RP2S-4]
MDIFIMLLIFILFLILLVKKETNYKVIGLWLIVCLLMVILYFLHATSSLDITL